MPTTEVINLSTLNWFALISSTASLILAILSIYLAVHFFIKSKSAEQQASNLLTKVSSQTDVLQKVSNRMLDKYVDYSTQSKPADEAFILLTQVVQGTLSQGLSDNGGTTSNQKVMQHLTTTYIAILYWSALANIFSQQSLPQDINEVEGEYSWVKTLIDRSFNDYTVSLNWLNENGGDFISTSGASYYYSEILGLDAGAVKDTFTAYAQRSSE